MDPAARGLNEHLDLQDCSLEEYYASLDHVREKDAIMDDDIFSHLKKITSFQYNLLYPGSSNRSDYATTRSLNREALKMLVEGYEGYAWLCQSAADLLTALEEVETKSAKEVKATSTGISDTIYRGLCEQLVTHYDTNSMRRYMDQQRDHGSWNPPEFYWQLMNNPTVISTMLKIYHEKPKDEFLACWYQDYVHIVRSFGTVPSDLLSIEELSKLTSNFNVFTLRMSEEISKYLLKDVRTEFDEVNPDNICQLFCYAENAYFYSQALLHFIVRWRPDLSGSRRLSQLLCKNIMNPPSYWLDINKREKEYSASQLNLLMTNLCKYKKLYKLFRSISQTQVDGRLILDSDEICEFFDTLQLIVDSFESYQTLLYEQPNTNVSNKFSAYQQPDSQYSIECMKYRTQHCTNKSDLTDNKEKFIENTTNLTRELQFEPFESTVDLSRYTEIMDPEIYEIVNLQSASLYGGDGYYKERYNRIRTAPEAPPMEALRESSFLDRLLEDFIDERISLSSNQAWIKYAELLILLTIHSPYEMLVMWEEDKQYRRALRQGLQGVWKYEFHSDDFDEGYDEDEDIYSDEAEDSDGEALLDSLFEEPEHHMPGSSFRDHTNQRQDYFVPYNNSRHTQGIPKRRANCLENTPDQSRNKRRRWDSKGQITSLLHSNNILRHNINNAQENGEDSDESFSVSDSSISNSKAPEYSIPYSSQDEQSDSENSQSTSSQLLSEQLSDLNPSVYTNSLSQENPFHPYDRQLSSEPIQFSTINTENYSHDQPFSPNSQLSSEEGSLDTEVKEDNKFTDSLERSNHDHLNRLSNFLLKDNVQGRGKQDIFSKELLVSNPQQHLVKNSKVKNNILKPQTIENQANDSDSMVASSIFKDSLHGTKLGVDKKMSYKKAQKLRQLYQTFKEDSKHYKTIARRELYQIFKITRDKFQGISNKMNAFRTLMTTNVAASAILKYIEYIILQASPDPLISLSDSILLILKQISDIHSPQISAILTLLRKTFECGVDDSDGHLSYLHNSQKTKIINFFVYLCRFENEYISVVTIIHKLFEKMDKSMIRAFLILLFEYCGPPYSSEFCRPLINILKRCLDLSILDWGEKLNSNEPKKVQRLVLQFLEEAKHCDQPNSAPQDILDQVEVLQNEFHSLKYTS